MQENLTIARPYAQAVFEQAQQEGKFSEWTNMLELLELVVSDADMKTVMDNPRLDGQFVADFILDVCSDHLQETGQNFVRVLAAAGRLELVPEISDLFAVKRAESESTIDVEVLSAYPLDANQESSISKLMADQFGKNIKITSNIDESLIGGVVIKAGDSVIDASIKGRLKELANVIAK